MKVLHSVHYIHRLLSMSVFACSLPSKTSFLVLLLSQSGCVYEREYEQSKRLDCLGFKTFTFLLRRIKINDVNRQRVRPVKHSKYCEWQVVLFCFGFENYYAQHPFWLVLLNRSKVTKKKIHEQERERESRFSEMKLMHSSEHWLTAD